MTTRLAYSVNGNTHGNTCLGEMLYACNCVARTHCLRNGFDSCSAAQAARRERIRFHNVYRPAEAIVSAEGEPAFEDQPEMPPRRGESGTEPAVPSHRGGTPETSNLAFGVPEQIVRVHNAPLGGPDAAPLLKGYELEDDQ